MKLSQALRLNPIPRVALVGAGGKTTAMFLLAKELEKPVLLTATTHLAPEQLVRADAHIVITSQVEIDKLDEKLKSGVVLVTGSEDRTGRVKGLTQAFMAALRDTADRLSVPMIIEADGSRQLPLKAPADHEPAIPGFVDLVIVVTGISALGRPLTDQWVHRPERFGELSGLYPGEIISPEALVKVLIHPSGGLKGIPVHTQRVLLLNQADDAMTQAQAQSLVLSTSKGYQLLGHYQSILVASLAKEEVSAAYEPVAGIVLAAGGATRFGSAKQLLNWHGESLVRRSVRLAIEAGLSPVVVVTGAYSDEVQSELDNLPVLVVENPAWALGQSTSVKAGLAHLPRECRAVIFLLADQPLASKNLIQALVESHASSMSPIVAPLVDGKRSNPVLFDWITFKALSDLSGDAGGRTLFAHYPVSWLPWHDPRLLLDVDTPEDYQRLLEQG